MIFLHSFTIFIRIILKMRIHLHIKMWTRSSTVPCTVLYCTVSLYLIGDEGGELGEVVEVSRLDPVPGLCVSHADLMQIYHFIYYSMNFVPFFRFFMETEQ